MRIETIDLSKSFGANDALFGVFLAFEPGAAVAVLGANGAGKSTLLRLLATVSTPTRGRIVFDGEELFRENLRLRRRLGFLPDFPTFPDPNATVVEYVAAVLPLYGLPSQTAKDRTMPLLEAFDLLPLIDARVVGLSRGETYKTGLVPLLAAEPDLLLLDEPFASGMDPRGLNALRAALKRRSAAGGITIFTTQLVEIALNAAERLVVLERGQVRLDETAAELRQRGDPEQLTAEFFGPWGVAPHAR